MRLKPQNRHVKVLIQEFEGGALVEPNKHHSKTITLYDTTPAEVEREFMEFLKNRGVIEDVVKKKRHYQHTKKYKEAHKMRAGREWFPHAEALEKAIYREREKKDEAEIWEHKGKPEKVTLKPAGFIRMCKICKERPVKCNGLCHKCYNRESWRKRHWN